MQFRKRWVIAFLLCLLLGDYLYYPDGYTLLTVVENGNISVEPDMRSDRRRYFDGGEELFDTLRELAEG